MNICFKYYQFRYLDIVASFFHLFELHLFMVSFRLSPFRSFPEVSSRPTCKCFRSEGGILARHSSSMRYLWFGSTSNVYSGEPTAVM